MFVIFNVKNFLRPLENSSVTRGVDFVRPWQSLSLRAKRGDLQSSGDCFVISFLAMTLFDRL